MNKKIFYGDTSLVITLSESMKDYIIAKYKVNNLKVIPPWVNTDDIKPLSFEENIYSDFFVPKNTFVVLYSGNMGISHDFETILKVMDELKNDKKIFFLLIGNGVQYRKVEKVFQEIELKMQSY